MIKHLLKNKSINISKKKEFLRKCWENEDTNKRLKNYNDLITISKLIFPDLFGIL